MEKDSNILNRLVEVERRLDDLSKRFTTAMTSVHEDIHSLAVTVGIELPSDAPKASAPRE